MRSRGAHVARTVAPQRPRYHRGAGRGGGSRVVRAPPRRRARRYAGRALRSLPVIPVEAALHSAAAHLHEIGARFALVGGLAVSTWAEPRTTRDVDLAVAVETDAEAEALVYALRDRGYSIVQVIDHAPTARLGTARLAGPGRPPVMTDLLFASSGIEDLVVAEAMTTTVLPGLTVPVARPG